MEPRMDFQNDIIEFLGIQDVEIQDIKRFKKDLRAEITVRQRRATCFCEKCGLEYSKVKEWTLKQIKAPPLGVYQRCTIKLWQMRGYCEDCQNTSVSRLNWLHPKFESMTCGFAEVAGRLMEEITCQAVGRILSCDPKLMWNLDQHRMEVMLQYLQLPKNIDVSYLCADEIHFRSEKVKNRKGLFAPRYTPKFVTNLVCPSEGKVLFNAMGRGKESLTTAMSVLSKGQKLAVAKFAVDIHDPFMSAIRENCPNAEVVIDRFHLVQKVNEAFDRLRKSEFEKAKKDKDANTRNMLEPYRRFILMSRDADLSNSEQNMIDRLRQANHKIHAGMLLVETFHRALDQKTISGFRRDLKRWYLLCRNAKLESFLTLAKMIRKYRLNIESYITSRLTTAVIEGLNNKIKVLKRMGYEYSNPVSFMRKILQRCGYLNHLSINTDEFYFKWPNPA